jgi:hypothetical protein
MIEFIRRVDPNRFGLPPVELTAVQSAMNEAVPEDIKIAVTGHI